jgi:hypothetical protein
MTPACTGTQKKVRQLMSIRPFIALVLILALTACGGGSNGGGSSSGGGPGATPGDRVAVSLTAPLQSLPGGAAFNMTMRISNPGSTNATNVRVQLDMGFAFSRGGAVCAARNGAVCPTSSTSFDVATLPAGSELEFTIAVFVSSGASGPNNTVATVTADDETPGANNEARLMISAYTPDVFVSMQTAGSNYSGSIANYPMRVGNDGPDTARDVIIENVVGPGQMLSSVTCTASGGAVCPTSLGAIMTIPTLPNGGSLDFVIAASIAPDVIGVISNTLRVSAPGDQTSHNNVATSSGTTRVATSPSSQSFVMLNSDSNDYIGLGRSYYYDRSNALLDVIEDENSFRVIVNGDENWSGSFASPGTTGPIVPGSGTSVGWGGEGRGCNRATGTYTIDAVTYTAGTLSSIDLRFEQHCEGAGPALYGQIHWVIDDDQHPPGPVNPPPAGLWQPPAGATPASGNYVYLQSDGGDYIGLGRTYLYTQASAVLEVNLTGNQLRVSVTGNERWGGTFQGLSAVATIQPGYYGGVQRWPFHNPVKGGLDWSGEGRGCNELSGWFSIDSVTMSGSVITSLDLRFEQHCEKGPPALRGKVHWTSGDPTQPTGPLFPPPTNLWRPAAGATPATGNYVYLTSSANDYIGLGRTYTYTQSDAELEVAVIGARLSVDVDGFESWFGEFQAMNSLQQLQPGYYPNLLRYPFHNPVAGGLSWSGEGRGCNELTGWFVIDNITFAAGNLASVDMRFEQHCDGGPALNGQVHWVAGDPTAPSGPQLPPPPNLWQPPAGATPATGNYVYLVSDPGDWVGSGRTYTYTPSNATLTTQSGLRFFQMNVLGQESWTGNFYGMNAIEVMQPGYYGEIQRPGGNPTRGAIDWSGEARGCNTISGWFVIDSITFAGGNLASIEMRFEQHCEEATPALRGKIRWVR